MRPLIVDCFAGDLTLGKLLGLCRNPVLAEASSIDSPAVHRNSADDSGQVYVVPGPKALFGHVSCLLLWLVRHGVVLRRAAGNIPLPNGTNSASDDRFHKAAVPARYRTNPHARPGRISGALPGGEDCSSPGEPLSKDEGYIANKSATECELCPQISDISETGGRHDG